VLDHLLSELTARGITPVIMTLPVLPSYAQPAKATESWARMQRAIADLCAAHRVRYFNYFEDPRFVVSDFQNSDHLNEQGAIKFTRIVDSDIVPVIEGAR